MNIPRNIVISRNANVRVSGLVATWEELVKEYVHNGSTQSRSFLLEFWGRISGRMIIAASLHSAANELFAQMIIVRWLDANWMLLRFKFSGLGCGGLYMNRGTFTTPSHNIWPTPMIITIYFSNTTFRFCYSLIFIVTCLARDIFMCKFINR